MSSQFCDVSSTYLQNFGTNHVLKPRYFVINLISVWCLFCLRHLRHNLSFKPHHVHSWLLRKCNPDHSRSRIQVHGRRSFEHIPRDNRSSQCSDHSCTPAHVRSCTPARARRTRRRRQNQRRQQVRLQPLQSGQPRLQLLSKLADVRGVDCRLTTTFDRYLLNHKTLW